jgi:hypothetical protein
MAGYSGLQSAQLQNNPRELQAREAEATGSAMTVKLIRNLLKSLVAFVIIASLSSASFAGEFTVHQGNRYRATLSLNSVERLADNALIARKFRALGFSNVRVSGTGTIRRVEGVWPRRDASAPLPPQIIAVAKL